MFSIKLKAIIKILFSTDSCYLITFSKKELQNALELKDNHPMLHAVRGNSDFFKWYMHYFQDQNSANWRNDKVAEIMKSKNYNKNE